MEEAIKEKNYQGKIVHNHGGIINKTCGMTELCKGCSGGCKVDCIRKSVHWEGDDGFEGYSWSSSFDDNWFTNVSIDDPDDMFDGFGF